MVQRVREMKKIPVPLKKIPVFSGRDPSPPNDKHKDFEDAVSYFEERAKKKGNIK